MIKTRHFFPFQTLASAASLLVFTTQAIALPSDVTRIGPTRAVTTLAEGIAIADPGDVLLLDPATYVETVSLSEGIAIVVDGGRAVLEGRLAVAGVPAGEGVLITDLDVAPPQGQPTCEPAPALTVSHSTGAVQLQDCTVTGAVGLGYCPTTEGRGGDSVHIDSSFNVILQSCELRGGLGGSAQSGTFSPPGGTGGTALSITRGSQVTLSSSLVKGGRGGLSSAGGDGGTALAIGSAPGGDSSKLFAHGSQIRGGGGGVSIDVFNGDGGAGAVLATANEIVRLQDTGVFGGRAGDGGFIGGTRGPDFVGEIIPPPLFGSPCTLVAPNRILDGESWQIRVENLGARNTASLLVAFEPTFEFTPALERPLLVNWPAPGAIRFHPIPADAAGAATYSFGPNPPPVGDDALIIWTQMFCIDTNGRSRLSESRALVLLAAGV